MKKIIISLLVLAVAGIASYYFVFKNLSGVETNVYIPSTQTTDNSMNNMEMQTPTTLEKVVPKATSSNTSAPLKVAVSIKNFSFNPSMISIKTGTTVIWTNDDSVAHTVTSDSDGILNSPTLSPGQSFSFTFTKAGTTNYHCAIHPSMMKGSVVVSN